MRRVSRLIVTTFISLLYLGAIFGLSTPSGVSPHAVALGPHPVLASVPLIGCGPNETWATGMNGAAGQCLAISGDVATCLSVGGVPAIYPGGVFVCGGVQPPPPPPNPDKPGVAVGAACIAGDTRVVKLSPGNNSGGATFTVRMATVGTEAKGPFTTQSGPGTTYTYSGLAQDVAYVFQAQATTNNGSSGWTAWLGPVKQDLNPPTTTYTPVSTAGTNGWWKTNVSVSLPAVDRGCLGVKATTYTLDSNPPATYTGTPFPVTGDGIHTLSFYSTDGVHTETPQTATIKIDTTPPTLTMTPSRPPDTTYGWWHSTPTITLAVSDATSGVASTTIQIDGGAWTAWNGKTITFQGDLKHTLNVKVTDNAGNVTTNGWVFPVDSTPPQVGLNYDKPHGPNGWFTSSPVEVYLTTSDNLSGLALTMIQVDGQRDPWRVSVVGDGVHVVAWFVYDKAGNQNVSMMPVQIDTTPPDVGSVSCGPSSIVPGQSWSLSASVGDNASGVQTLTMNVNGAESGSASTSFPAGTLSTNATLSDTPNTVGSYSVDLVLTDYAGHTTTRSGVCSFSVALTVYSVARPTTTMTLTPIYKIVTNTPTPTPTDSGTPQPLGTIPPTNTLGADGTGGADATQAAISPTSTATSTPVAVAMVLPGSGSNNSGTNSTGGGGSGDSSYSVTAPPDLNSLLEQAGLLGGAGAAVAISAWAIAQDDEQKKKKARQQAALKLALQQQSQQAQTTYKHNQDMQAAAPQEVRVATSPSDAWIAYEGALTAYYEGIAFRKGEEKQAEQYWQQQAFLEQQRKIEAAREAALAAYYAQRQREIGQAQAKQTARRKNAQLEAADAGMGYSATAVAETQIAAAQGEDLSTYLDAQYVAEQAALAEKQRQEAAAAAWSSFRQQELAYNIQSAQSEVDAQAQGAFIADKVQTADNVAKQDAALNAVEKMMQTLSKLYPPATNHYAEVLNNPTSTNTLPDGTTFTFAADGTVTRHTGAFGDQHMTARDFHDLVLMHAIEFETGSATALTSPWLGTAGPGSTHQFFADNMDPYLNRMDDLKDRLSQRDSNWIDETAWQCMTPEGKFQALQDEKAKLGIVGGIAVSIPQPGDVFAPLAMAGAGGVLSIGSLSTTGGGIPMGQGPVQVIDQSTDPAIENAGTTTADGNSNSGWTTTYTTENGDSMDAMTNVKALGGQPYQYGKISDLAPNQQPTSYMNAIQKLVDNVLAPGENVETQYIVQNDVPSYGIKGLEKSVPIPEDPALRAAMKDADVVQTHPDVSALSAGDIASAGAYNTASVGALIRTDNGVFMNALVRPEEGWSGPLSDPQQASFIQNEVTRAQKTALQPVLDNQWYDDSQRAYDIFRAQVEANSKFAGDLKLTDNFYQYQDGQLTEVPRSTVYKAVQQYFKANPDAAAKLISDTRQFVNQK